MLETTWELDNTDKVGGHSVEIIGSPRAVTVPERQALEFDGEKDGIIVPIHPLAGAKAFTIEAIFRPDVQGQTEQRFVHLQEESGEGRILLETRLVDGDKWFLDTFVYCSEEANQTLFAEEFLHPVGNWYHVVLVFDGSEMRHYVDGHLELCGPLDFTPARPGQTSLGMRWNRVSWFKGAIHKLRFSDRALSEAEFMNLAGI